MYIQLFHFTPRTESDGSGPISMLLPGVNAAHGKCYDQRAPSATVSRHFLGPVLSLLGSFYTGGGTFHAGLVNFV